MRDPVGRDGQRGVLLTLAVIIAVIGAIASMTVLQLAYYQTRHARFHRLHLVSQYAAEAGVVWAQERLLQNPASCAAMNAANPDVPIDHDSNGATPPINVDVTVAPCPGADMRVTARVVY